jgi:hypothetical protein
VAASSRRYALSILVILLGSDAFFWHTRDWNTGSRLMLTYALVDRGTVSISHLERQTGDKAWFQGQYYSDKLPGYPLLATLPYAAARWALRLPSHPLDRAPINYWAADYWVTLGTSGVFTAGTALLLFFATLELGCSRGRAALLALAYGLATPAYVYATLAYGHQTSAFALFACFYLLWKKPARHVSLRMFSAGFLAAYAAVIELQVGPVSAILGFYLLAQCLRRARRPDALGLFAVGSVIPTLILLTYNHLAFGSPWRLGYFLHTISEFKAVHNAANPLGLSMPDQFWDKLRQLVWGEYRGILFYAPILLLSVPGWVVLLARRSFELAVVTLLVVAAILLVNLFYPEWTGGWSTGPRLLVPLIPFAVLPVGALLAGNSPGARVAATAALFLSLAGGVLMLLYQGVDGRIPADVLNPLVKGVWPLWIGKIPLPWWRYDERFACTLVSIVAPKRVAGLDSHWQAVQFLPLVVFQVLGIGWLWRLDRPQRGQ